MVEGKVKPILELLTHQDFKVLGSFNVEPSKEEIFEIIEKVYNKKVIDFERLDSENFLFIFEDNSSIELLIRDCK